MFNSIKLSVKLESDIIFDVNGKELKTLNNSGLDWDIAECLSKMSKCEYYLTIDFSKSKKYTPTKVLGLVERLAYPYFSKKNGPNSWNPERFAISRIFNEITDLIDNFMTEYDLEFKKF